jgi:hypothetical protein
MTDNNYYAYYMRESGGPCFEYDTTPHLTLKNYQHFLHLQARFHSLYLLYIYQNYYLKVK